MKKKLWIAILLIATIVIVGYNYIYKEHRNISSERADHTISSTSLSNDFINDTNNSESKYLNKTIEVTGIISEINENDITLNDIVFCNFASGVNTKSLKLKTPVTIKGRCIGYDDLLEQVKLDQCTIIN
ncbi:OB-fold protein [Lacinutrix chionoecetis]